MTYLKWGAAYVALTLMFIVVLSAIVGPRGRQDSAPSSKAEVAMDGEPITPWPFKVKSVVLTCDQPENITPRVRRVYVITNGTVYAVNGSARPFAPPTEPIEIRSDTSAVILRGVKLCDDHAGPITIRDGS